VRRYSNGMRLEAEDDFYELPGTYVIGRPRSRRPSRTAIAGIIVFVMLLAAAVAGAIWAGTALRTLL
jgi:hypothetical protein